MSILVIHIPPRHRVGPQPAVGSGAGAVPVGSEAGEWFWVLTEDGSKVQRQGHSPLERLPTAEAAVLVLSELDVSWHKLAVPRGPASKLRAAVLGALEEALLSEPEHLHAALPPQHQPGAPAWVAVVDRAWLAETIASIERRGLLVDRVVPTVWPGDSPRGQFFDAAQAGQTPQPALALADGLGIVCLPLSGTLARSLVPAATAEAVRWTTVPSVATAAERWLGTPVRLQSVADRLLAAARSAWNLRQFDLTARRRGALALRDVGRRLMRPTWRPVRLGLAALAVLHVAALNLWAWSQRVALDDKRQAQAELLMSTHPGVRIVRDAPLQMERETEALRAAAGKTGSTDLESMLSAVASAWPDSQGPMQNLKFQPGTLSLSTPGWSAEDQRQFASRLKPAGWALDAQQGRVTVSLGAAR